MHEPTLPRDELLVGIVNARSDFHVASSTKPYSMFSRSYKLYQILHATCLQHAGCRFVREIEMR
jgi:hypothetical protein